MARERAYDWQCLIGIKTRRNVLVNEHSNEFSDCYRLNSTKDSRVDVWIREFLLGRTQRIRVGGHLLEEVRGTSRDPQGCVLGPLLFLAYVLSYKSYVGSSDF